jgi:hypothetical protein
MPSFSATPRTALASVALLAGGSLVLALPAQAGTEVSRPSSFTSTVTVQATAAEVTGDNSGDSQASASYVLELNSDVDVLCYSITTRGVNPPFESPARTATHIHEAAAGQSGPPRLVFADPSSASESDPRTSAACLQGPFTTGVTGDAGTDTGAGFTVAELEADPTAYYVDIHTSQFPGGSLRGQIPAVMTVAAPAEQAPQEQAAPTQQQDSTPVGGVAAGFGGLAQDGPVSPAAAALAAALVALSAGLTGAAWVRRRQV